MLKQLSDLIGCQTVETLTHHGAVGLSDVHVRKAVMIAWIPSVQHFIASAYPMLQQQQPPAAIYLIVRSSLWFSTSRTHPALFKMLSDTECHSLDEPPWCLACPCCHPLKFYFNR